ncbi:hypothetical protein ANO11243_032170 [Dothideomycetidae sp. 11243]|nr:hypothetical protein ANO11243_032170 [fungal sp. No.11243]
MRSGEAPVVLKQDASLNAAVDLIGPDSYTARRLQHADAEHLHLTSRRCFVGPIPEGWLKSHRKQWYKHYLGIHHSSRIPSFSAPSNVGSHRRITGLEHANVRPSFPQPRDALDGPAAEGESSDADGDEGDGGPPGMKTSRVDNDTPVEVLGEYPPSNTDEPVSEFDTQISMPLQPRTNRSKAKPSNRRQKTSKPRLNRVTSTTSYETAHEYLGEINPDPLEEEDEEAEHERAASTGKSVAQQNSSSIPSARERRWQCQRLPIQAGTAPILQHREDKSFDQPRTTSFADPELTNGERQRHRRLSRAKAKVHFDMSNNPRLAEVQVLASIAQSNIKRPGRALTRGRPGSGKIVKMEKMLLRIDVASGSEQPEADFSEKDSQHIETRVLEKWREFVVVCRECDDQSAALTLEMYQTRVIPAASRRDTKRKFKYEILLDPAKVRVNLYSALDKTIAICVREGPRTKVHFLRTRSGTNSVEWFHFLRQVLGLRRAKVIQVNIPDLNASIRLDNPFDRLLGKEDLALAAAGDETALAKAVGAESAVAQNIVDRCLEILSKGDEWKEVLKSWANHDRIGLAWRRYDRLEWIYGEHERKMYGANAMLRSHQLELRCKQHYPQETKTPSGEKIPEPAPVEGFLIRLTSQKGAQQKLGKFFFKRLYFATHSQFLLFLRPAKARPPPPPKMPMNLPSKIPSTEQISGKIPLIFAVNPFPLENGEIPWLAHEDRTAAIIHDSDAEDEAERNIDMLHNCDGFINLCHVMKVRKFTVGADASDDQTGEGSDVDFDQNVSDSRAPDGITSELDQDRTFEMVLKNGLVVRLQAYNKATKEEWIQRLRDLVTYWHHRSAADMELFRFVRSENLRELNIDERAEAYVGQFAQKWEVSKSFVSPELYHMCGISSCRAIHNAGVLYRKPRIHSTFNRCFVILCSGHLIIFQDSLRTRTGKKQAHIHHERLASIDLKDCYLYSGLITEDDLLYQNRTFDSNAPGSHALPRMFLEDSWTSTDEDAMTTFVIWHGQRKGWFRSKEIDDVKSRNEKSKTKQKLKRVNQLGVKGRSIVFKARSRAERDHWVMAIAAEIEKVAKDDGVRVVGDDKKQG